MSRVVALAEVKKENEVMSGMTENNHMMQMRDMASAAGLAANK